MLPGELRLQQAIDRLFAAFHAAGHTSVVRDNPPDLTSVFKQRKYGGEMQDLYDLAADILKDYRNDLTEDTPRNLHKAVQLSLDETKQHVYDKRGEDQYWRYAVYRSRLDSSLPDHADVLALRFATLDERLHEDIRSQLETYDALWLWEAQPKPVEKPESREEKTAQQNAWEGERSKLVWSPLTLLKDLQVAAKARYGKR